jgi:hypothetical protein
LVKIKAALFTRRPVFSRGKMGQFVRILYRDAKNKIIFLDETVAGHPFYFSHKGSFIIESVTILLATDLIISREIF